MMMSRKMSDLHPQVRVVFEGLLEELRQTTGQDIKVSWTYRNQKEQNGMVKKGVSKAYYPNSNHNFTMNGKPASLAMDIYNNVKGHLYDIDWDIVRDLCEKWGCEWGGNWTSFPDKPHIQYIPGKPSSNPFKKYKAWAVGAKICNDKNWDVPPTKAELIKMMNSLVKHLTKQ